MKQVNLKKANFSAPQETLVRYYDKNTRRFLKFGGSPAAAAIHRQIWAPGIRSRHESLLYLNRLVQKFIQPLQRPEQPLRLLDLGCGVGGTALWLASHLDAQVTGVTLSPVQVELATRHAKIAQLNKKCQFLLADFHHLPDLGLVEAAYAIESFAHATDGRQFFAEAGKNLCTGGRFILCDDFLSAPETMQPKLTKKAHIWQERLRKGWHLETLMTPQEAVQLAEVGGFQLEQDENLTPFLRPYFSKFVLALLKIIARIPIRTPFWDNIRGGVALQVCQRNRWTTYHCLIFRKQ